MTKNKITLILVSVIIIAAFGYLSFNYFQKQLQIPGEGFTSEKIDLCAKFLEIQGEITCEKAIELSLREYLGDVEYVDKVILPEEEILWEVGIDLNETVALKNLPQKIDKIRIIINVKTSEIISVRPGR